MVKFTGTGIAAGLLTWFAIMSYYATKVDCVKTNSCGAGDLIMFAFVGVGMFAPAGIVAALISDYPSN